MVRLATESVDAERQDLGNGVSMPRAWTAIVHEEPGVPGTVRIRATLDQRLGRSAAESVAVQRVGEGDEVTSITLRAVRVQAALQATGLMVATVEPGNGKAVSGAAYIMRMRERADRTPAESVVDAATLYRLAIAVNLPPLKTVADCLGVSQSTATRLMNRARIDGLADGIRLPDADATGPVAQPQDVSGPTLR